MKKASILIVITTLVAAAGCGEAKDDPEPVAPPPEGPLCTRGSLEEDLEMVGPLAGAGVDPETGAITPPPSGSYVVSATYLALRPEPQAQERFGQLLGPIREQLKAQAGLVGIQLASSKACGSARTLSVWASEDAMYEFVLSPAHTEAVKSFGEVSRGGSLVTHWVSTSTADIHWEEAAKQLGAMADTYD